LNPLKTIKKMNKFEKMEVRKKYKINLIVRFELLLIKRYKIF